MINTIIKRIFANPAIIPVLVTVLCLAPFAGKAFHLDDPLFVWSAKQIQKSPTDFFGFVVNWGGFERPMSQVTKNPPLACYYIAMAGSLFGFSEIALHIAFLIPAVAVAMGTYYLGKQLFLSSSLAVFAAVGAVLTPVFLVSSANVMSDTMMVAFFVWAVLLWVYGTKSNNKLSLFFAAVLIAFSALSKYFGIVLVGLLFAYSLMYSRRLGLWVLFLLIPVAVLAGYDQLTYILYGGGLLSKAADYAIKVKGKEGAILKVLTSLAFTGGCIATVLFYSPLLWCRKVLIFGLVLVVLLIIAASSMETIGVFIVHDADGIRLGSLVQFSLMVVTGLSLLVLAGVDFWKCRDADSLLLFLWVVGTFVFTGFVNWAINARSVLPIVPAAGILLMRRVGRAVKGRKCPKNQLIALPLIPAAIIALLVGWADYTLAATAKEAANVISKKFTNPDRTVWFQGHWGFQYYMEAAGCRPIDYDYPEDKSGDIIIIPLHNTNLRLLPIDKVYLVGDFKAYPYRWLSTMKTSVGAGFYAEGWGPLPFAFGRGMPEKYQVFIVK